MATNDKAPGETPGFLYSAAIQRLERSLLIVNAAPKKFAAINVAAMIKIR
jgi:hypothetical protein